MRRARPCCALPTWASSSRQSAGSDLLLGPCLGWFMIAKDLLRPGVVKPSRSPKRRPGDSVVEGFGPGGVCRAGKRKLDLEPLLGHVGNVVDHIHPHLAAGTRHGLVAALLDPAEQVLVDHREDARRGAAA